LTAAAGFAGSSTTVIRPIAWFFGTVCVAGETTNFAPMIFSSPEARTDCANDADGNHAINAIAATTGALCVQAGFISAS
jgi:hypothetical protein